MKYLDICKITWGFYEWQLGQLIDYLESDKMFILKLWTSVIPGQVKQAAVSAELLEKLTKEEVEALSKPKTDDSNIVTAEESKIIS
jgi:hypothetical protein